MPSDFEVLVNRRQTEAFIGYDPVTVVLNYADVINLPDGGFRRQPPSVRVPQTARLWTATAGSTPVRRQVDGEEVEIDYFLLMPWDAVIERGDWFFINGLKYEVVWVPQGVTRAYEVKAEVVLRG